MAERQSFTGYSRRRKTSRLVWVGDVVSRAVITVGGIGTIVAVALVCVFLLWVVVPLFRGATVHETQRFALSASPPLRLVVNDYQTLAWALDREGTLTTYRLDNGHVLGKKPLFPGKRLTACSAPDNGETLAFGFDDGSVVLGRVGFANRFVEGDAVPADVRDLAPGQLAEFDGGVVVRTPEGQVRGQKVTAELEEEPAAPAGPTSVRLVDLTARSKDAIVARLTADGTLRMTAVESHGDEPALPGATKSVFGELMLPARPTPPDYLLVSGVGDNVFVAWRDGHLVRVSTSDVEKPRLVEETELLGQPGLTLTALQFQIGKSTLLAGDSSGRVRAWFLIKPAGAATADGAVLAAAHDLPGPSQSAVTSLATSSRTRMAVAGYADGRVRLFYVTSEKLLADVATGPGQAVDTLTLAPKDDGLVALGGGTVLRWSVNPGYPEATPESLILPVWYEGDEKPNHVWQSSSGSDEFEPKFGLWPLVFGTLKATFYSLLLGVPLALLAAIYTSEFLHPNTRSVVKPTIELMASLPSVVLGFLAALVLAPFVEDWIGTVLAALLTVPLAFILGAYLWQLLPEKWALLLGRYRTFFIAAALPVGLIAAIAVGAGVTFRLKLPLGLTATVDVPGIASLFFQGDVKGWLAGGQGGAAVGWAFLLLPLSAVATAYFLGRVVNPWLRSRAAGWGRFQTALADLAKFAAGAVLTVLAAWLVGSALSAIGLDPRGSIVGTYVQRNALVVGFMMGFAIIPIIYTIAEDALSSVPEHLRAAALGCGATRWQTAQRVIIPTAMSGLFSAVMVGLGRAVGETMIVLMAAGNTPVLDMNLFNGFRTLAANIAVEMPEAVPGSTHYRTLFLAALTLFAMTFVVNTVAETIRMRFRKRAFQL